MGTIVTSRVRVAISRNASFLQPAWADDNLDRYIVRTAILRELRAATSVLRGRVLDVGCGQKPYRDMLLAASHMTEYVGLDLPTERYGVVTPDLVWDGHEIPAPDASFDCAIATEVLEHCPDPGSFLREVCRVLKPGGCVFFTVPFLWPLHEVPHDEYRYTPFALNRLLIGAGLERPALRALGGWDASLAQMLGLWVRRRPMSSWRRAVASRLLKPIIHWLIRRDDLPAMFSEGTMITGVAGLAWKPIRS